MWRGSVPQRRAACDPALSVSYRRALTQPSVREVHGRCRTHVQRLACNCTAHSLGSYSIGRLQVVSNYNVFLATTQAQRQSSDVILHLCDDPSCLEPA